MESMRTRIVVATVLLAVAAAAIVLPAGATFEGANGPITYFKDDGSSIEIYRAKADGSGEVKLTSSAPGISVNSDWSPDGSMIAFDSNREGDVEVYVMNSDGTGEVAQLTHNDTFDGFASWSPDGRWIAFDSEAGDGRGPGIWRMQADGSGLTRVTTVPPGYDFDTEPAFSPDGRWIAFTRAKGTCKFHDDPDKRFVAAGCTSAIHLVRTDGSGLRRLTAWGHNGFTPEWSPDGTTIAYHRCDTCTSGRLDIYVMNADGSGERALTVNPPYTGRAFSGSGNPVYSPDGRRIMFTQWSPDRFAQIMVMDADGSNVQRVTQDDGAFHNEADWGSAGP